MGQVTARSVRQPLSWICLPGAWLCSGVVIVRVVQCYTMPPLLPLLLLVVGVCEHVSELEHASLVPLVPPKRQPAHRLRVPNFEAAAGTG